MNGDDFLFSRQNRVSPPETQIQGAERDHEALSGTRAPGGLGQQGCRVGASARPGDPGTAAGCGPTALHGAPASLLSIGAPHPQQVAFLSPAEARAPIPAQPVCVSPPPPLPVAQGPPLTVCNLYKTRHIVYCLPCRPQ